VGGPGRAEQSAGQGGDEQAGTATSYLSTFELDVDTASYGFARRALTEGRLPDPATVRPEEFVNQLRQGYPEPDGSGFSITTDGGRLAATDEGDVRMLRIGLQTRAASPGGHRDANLTFVIDTSGSMAEPGRLDLVKDALHTLVGRLRPSDKGGRPARAAGSPRPWPTGYAWSWGYGSVPLGCCAPGDLTTQDRDLIPQHQISTSFEVSPRVPTAPN